MNGSLICAGLYYIGLITTLFESIAQTSIQMRLQFPHSRMVGPTNEDEPAHL